MRAAIDDVRAKVSEAIADGANLIILSDRHSSEELAPIPSLLLVSAVHHHLIREKTRTRVGLIVEAGDAREVHHMALLIGYGAAAINPYLAFETIDDLVNEGVIDNLTARQARKNYIKACGKGVLKVMSKMGISTVASYTGAQVFEAIGLGQELVDEYFTGHGQPARRHRPRRARRGGGQAPRVRASGDRPTELAHRDLDVGGEYQWRREGEYHLFNPETVFRLQHATRSKRYDIFKEYTRWSTTRPSGWPRCGACSGSRRAPARRCRSTRSSRSPRSSSASPPAPCRTAPSPRRRTRRWPSP